MPYRRKANSQKTGKREEQGSRGDSAIGIGIIKNRLASRIKATSPCDKG